MLYLEDAISRIPSTEIQFWPIRVLDK